MSISKPIIATTRESLQLKCYPIPFQANYYIYVSKFQDTLSFHIRRLNIVKEKIEEFGSGVHLSYSQMGTLLSFINKFNSNSNTVQLNKSYVIYVDNNQEIEKRVKFFKSQLKGRGNAILLHHESKRTLDCQTNSRNEVNCAVVYQEFWPMLYQLYSSLNEQIKSDRDKRETALIDQMDRDPDQRDIRESLDVTGAGKKKRHPLKPTPPKKRKTALSPLPPPSSIGDLTPDFKNDEDEQIGQSEGKTIIIFQ